MEQQQNNGALTPKRFEVTYQSAGQDVKLNADIVRNHLVRGNSDDITDTDLLQFITLCKYQQLNPFLNEAYLVKFKSKDGSGNAQIIVSKEAFLKRADTCPEYDGIKSGIIVRRGDKLLELDGCFVDDNDELVGGWAEVYRKDRRFPIIAKVSLKEYDKNNGLWSDKKSTMIAKVAKVQALREAFPAQLGALYTKEEQPTQVVVDAEFEEVNQAEANSKQIEFHMPATEATDKNPKPADRPATDGPGF